MSRYTPENYESNQDRWIVSYADFVTVLFGFFVVLYSISSVNEGEYRVLSDSMIEAFTGKSASEIEEILEQGELAAGASCSVEDIIAELTNVQGDDLLDADALAANEVEATELDTEELLADSFTDEALNLAEQEIDAIGAQVEEEMANLIGEDLIDVRRNKFWLEIEIKSNLLFPSGSSQLLEEAVPILTDLSRTFLGMPNRLNIEGFTDDEPISTEQFPSNWELSASRAATVVRLFETTGIEPGRMASIGYGEHQPISENQTPEGKARNRRVVIVVMASIRENSGDRIYDLDLLASE